MKECPECGSKDKTWGHLMECKNINPLIIMKKKHLDEYIKVTDLKIEKKDL